MMADRTLVSKNALRRRTAAARDALSPQEIEAKSRAIMDRLFVLEAFDAARVVALFASFRSEVRTGPMIAAALEEGKWVCLPRVTRGKRLRFYLVTDLARDLEPGCWGIPEPPTSLSQADPARVEAVVVPGLAFDPRGYRAGYGGGCYDRALRELPRAARIGLAFDCQLVERVPEAAHDLPVQWIITESQTIECHGA
jgi:5-formyltetrahydrofolate cyclo-ligase